MTIEDNNFQVKNNLQAYGDLLAANTGEANQSIGAINMLKRDRFELLSAYLDGEVSASERRQVEDWLKNEPETQRLYARLLKLRQSLQAMPMPSARVNAQQTVEQVYQKMHRRARRSAVVWGGGAIAAAFIGAVTLVLPPQQSFQLAKSPKTTIAIEPLQVALNDPVVEIPKPGIYQVKPSQSIAFPQQPKDFN